VLIGRRLTDLIIRLDFHTFLFYKWSRHSRIGLIARVYFGPWMSSATFHRSDEKKTGDTHSVTVPSGQRSHRIVLQCRHGRFSMTNIISQAVSAALCYEFRPACIDPLGWLFIRTRLPSHQISVNESSMLHAIAFEITTTKEILRVAFQIIIFPTFFFYVLFRNFFLFFERNYFIFCPFL